jgi:hypothetical protein
VRQDRLSIVWVLITLSPVSLGISSFITQPHLRLFGSGAFSFPIPNS